MEAGKAPKVKCGVVDSPRNVSEEKGSLASVIIFTFNVKSSRNCDVIIPPTHSWLPYQLPDHQVLL